MKLNHFLFEVVIVSILILSYPGFAQTKNNSTNQVETQISLSFGLSIDAPPVSYLSGVSGWEGYCSDFTKSLEKHLKKHYDKKVSIEIKQVSLENRFHGKGDDKTPLDGECGPNTITEKRRKELKDNKDIHGVFSNPFAWTGAKVLLKNENQKYFYKQEPFQGELIGVYGKQTTTQSLIGLVYTSAIIIKPVERKNAIEELNSENIRAYATDELILRSILEEAEKENSNIRQQYSILPYFRTLSNEAYGIVIYNNDPNLDLLNKINDFLLSDDAQDLRKKHHLENAQHNFLAGLSELYYYDLGFWIEIITLFILLILLTLFFLIKFTPTIINGKILDILKGKVERLKLSHEPRAHVILPILVFVVNIYKSVYEVTSNINFRDVTGTLGAVTGHDTNGVAGQDMTGVAGRDISGTVTSSIGQLAESNTPEASELAALLRQLQSAINDEPKSKLSKDDKAIALEQVKVLAEEGQKPKEGAMQKAAKTAILALKGIVSSLDNSAELAKTANRLLPMIRAVFEPKSPTPD